MDFVEVSAKTVDDAIIKASIELQTSSDRLEIQVVSEGSSGFLGFGAKPAVIKVRRKEEEPVAEVLTTPKQEVKEKPAETQKREAPQRVSRPESPKPAKPVQKKNEPLPAQSAAEDEKPVQQTRVVKTEEEVVTMKASAQKFLDSVFGAMNLTVDINMNYDQENGCLDVDFSGDDMGILIGKRGQTLDSLQYLTSLVVNKDQKDYVRVKLDTENYRKRRRETLENLSKNIAYKVRKTRKPVSLEPMNPYERRIIHSALQGNKWVETYSEGKEPYRHVVITPKR